jgi:hypothetical protein
MPDSGTRIPGLTEFLYQRQRERSASPLATNRCVRALWVQIETFSPETRRAWPSICAVIAAAVARCLKADKTLGIAIPKRTATNVRTLDEIAGLADYHWQG